MRNLTILLVILLIVSCKKEDSKPDPQPGNYVYKDASVQIDSCVATIVNGKFQVKIQGKFLNHNANGCELTATYNNAIVKTGDNINISIYPSGLNNYVITGNILTADTQYQNTLHVFILPDINSTNRYGIELKITFKI